MQSQNAAPSVEPLITGLAASHLQKMPDVTAVDLTANLINLSNSPRIFSVSRFLSDKECEHLVDLAKNQLHRSLGFDLNSGISQLTEHRTSSHCWLSYRQDEVVSEIEARLAQLTGVSIENGEQLSVLRYELGQEYKAHHDYFDPKFPGSASALARAGQRVATVLLYLHDVEEGGETHFPLLNLSVQPRKGMMLYFSNTQPSGEIDPNSLHAGVPVRKGVKWLATKWLRERAMQRCSATSGEPKPVTDRNANVE